MLILCSLFYIYMYTTKPTVLFSANNVTTRSPSTGQPVVFSSVTSNIGSSYSSTTGKFTAPVDGTYSFTVQLCSRSSQFSLVLDSHIVTLLLINDYYDYYTSSSSAPLFLRQGQKVWVRTEISCSSCLFKYSGCWNGFSGTLVHK